jgi:hypothetical protein
MTAIETSIQFESSINEKQYTSDHIDCLSDQEETIKLVQELRESNDWEEVIAYEHLSDSARSHSLTANTLRGENLIARRPVKFLNKDKTACVMAIHFGKNL